MPALSVDPTSREAVRQFFLAVYSAADDVPIEWTGNVSVGNAGTTSAAFKDAVLLRINAVRALAGVPASVTFNDDYNAKAQQAALMMSANQALSHSPPATWTFYSADGSLAAGKSNLYLRENGAAAITGYIADPGSNNAAVGHRRWLLYPQTREMGTGDIAESDSFPSANATWIIDSAFGTARPATRTAYIAWPYAGYVPANLIFPRWSFSHPGAIFSNATVTMTKDGATIPVKLEPLASDIGEPTLVWVYDNLDSNSAAPLKVKDDIRFRVTVANVVIDGTARSFTYDVIAFNPQVAGNDATSVAITGPASPVIGVANTYSATRPVFSDTLQWRTLQLENATPRYDAESGLGGLVATTTGTYGGRSTATRGAGNAAYQLATPNAADQFLTSPETFYASSNGSPQLRFLSRLGIASTGQTAHVQISLDEGSSWADVYTQTGKNLDAELSFTERTVLLSDIAGRTFRVRFVYTWTPAEAFYTDTTAGVGWFLDDITFTGVQRVSSPSAPASTAANAFTFTPANATATGLQARGLLFGTYPMAWGPVLATTPVPGTVIPGTPPSGSGRIVNLSVRANAQADTGTLIAGFVVAGSGSKNFAVRGVGPTLVGYGVTNAIPDPVLELHEQSRGLVAMNDDWGAVTTSANALRGTFNAVGAAPLTEGSKDAALLANLSAGVFSAQVITRTSGVALAEIYDTDAAAGPRLGNVSGRAPVTSGNGALIAGFVLSGTKTVLIRGIGPKLATYGVAGALADPVLVVESADGSLSHTNDNWESGSSSVSALNAAFASVGAFALDNGSKDAALLLTLPAGSYTAKVTGQNGGSGVGLVEVYEVQ